MESCQEDSGSRSSYWSLCARAFSSSRPWASDAPPGGKETREVVCGWRVTCACSGFVLWGVLWGGGPQVKRDGRTWIFCQLQLPVVIGQLQRQVIIADMQGVGVRKGWEDEASEPKLGGVE